MSLDEAIANFQPGLHRHYKGDYYLALFLATHSETREKQVIYVPYAHPESGVIARNLYGPDSWTELVTWTFGHQAVYPSTQSRFLRWPGSVDDQLALALYRNGQISNGQISLKK